MAAYSFKSVGQTTTQKQNEQLAVAQLPIGIKTPLQLSQKGDGVFATNNSLEDQIQNNLKDLLLTNHGERLMLTDYGANLRELTTEFASSDTFDADVMSRISQAIGKYMPYIDLETFETTADREHNISTGILRIKITYNVPALKISNKALEVVLWII